MAKKWIAEQSKMEAILRECPVGSLATVGPDGAPYVVTVNYVYHDGKIYLHGALAGKKMENIAHEPRVCFEVHVLEEISPAAAAIEFSTHYRSVIVHGRASQILDPAAKREALVVLTTRYADDNPFSPPSEEDITATAVLQIEIEEMTGKQNVPAR